MPTCKMWGARSGKQGDLRERIGASGAAVLVCVGLGWRRKPGTHTHAAGGEASAR